MSSRCSIYYENGWHIWWDVLTPEIILQAPNGAKEVLNLYEASELKEELEKALKYWSPEDK